MPGNEPISHPSIDSTSSDLTAALLSTLSSSTASLYDKRHAAPLLKKNLEQHRNAKQDGPRHATLAACIFHPPLAVQ